MVRDFGGCWGELVRPVEVVVMRMLDWSLELQTKVTLRYVSQPKRAATDMLTFNYTQSRIT
jgi:hypothetical protein